MSVALTGGCHCGAVRFTVTVTEPVTLTDCNCSICSATGFLHLIVTAEQFSLETDRAALTDYTFNTGTAHHLFCKTCGIKSFYVPRSHPDGYSVNWRAIADTKGIVPVIRPYDGANWEAARSTLDAG